jgi:hypothetical protein
MMWGHPTILFYILIPMVNRVKKEAKMDLLNEYTHNLLSTRSRQEERETCSVGTSGSCVKGSNSFFRSLLELVRGVKSTPDISPEKPRKFAT